MLYLRCTIAGHDYLLKGDKEVDKALTSIRLNEPVTIIEVYQEA